MTAHPAKFSRPVVAELVEVLSKHLPMGGDVLDPFGGIGGIHLLRPHWSTYAIELEPEWAREAAPLGPTWCGDFFDFGQPTHPAPPWWPSGFDAVVTSCTYANRMADSHTPGPTDTSKRNTYRHTLGRPLTENNSGGMQWGPAYRTFHKLAWRRLRRWLKPGALFVLNVSNHIRKGEEVMVAEWHRDYIASIGFELVEDRVVSTQRNRQGANGHLRVEGEHVYVFRWNG